MTHPFLLVSLIAVGLVPLLGLPGRAVAAQGKASKTMASATEPKEIAFHVDDKNGQVTVKDSDGKVLFSRQSPTPTILLVFGPGPAKSPNSRLVATDALLPRTLTLEDINGTLLWNFPLPVVAPRMLDLTVEATVSGTDFHLTPVPAPSLPLPKQMVLQKRYRITSNNLLAEEGTDYSDGITSASILDWWFPPANTATAPPKKP